MAEWKRKGPKKPPETLVLVGFGKRDLVEWIKLIGTEHERTLMLAPVNSPPRYRRESICSDEEINAFVTYGRFCRAKLSNIKR